MRSSIQILVTNPGFLLKLIKRLSFILLFVVLVSLSFLVGYFARMTNERDAFCVKQGDLPKVSDRFYGIHVDGPPQYEFHVLGPDNYVMHGSGIPVGINSNLVVSILDVVKKTWPWTPRLQFWIKADTRFEVLWQSIELCAAKISYFSLALRLADSKDEKSIGEKIADYFFPPGEGVYLKRFVAPSQIQVTTNMFVIRYAKNKLSVNNSECSFYELKRMIPLYEKCKIILLVSGDSSTQEVVSMMEKLYMEYYSAETYLGLLPNERTVMPGSTMSVIETSSW
jgi:hypothetical protein